MSDEILSLAPPRADMRVAYGGDANQFIDLRLPAMAAGQDAHPLAVCIHGGYWRAKYNLEYLGHLCAALTAKGIATANVEFRRVGDAGGGWPGTFADIRSAWQLLSQKSAAYKFDPRRMMVIGHSAGGQLALALAGHENGLAAAVSLAGVIDLQRAYDLHLSNNAVVEFLGGTPAEVPEHYREADPMKLSIRAKQWIVYGTADDHVPTELSSNYSATKKKAGEDLRLVEIAGADHFDIVDPRSRAWGAVERAVLDACQGMPSGVPSKK